MLSVESFMMSWLFTFANVACNLAILTFCVYTGSRIVHFVFEERKRYVPNPYLVMVSSIMPSVLNYMGVSLNPREPKNKTLKKRIEELEKELAAKKSDNPLSSLLKTFSPTLASMIVQKTGGSEEDVKKNIDGLANSPEDLIKVANHFAKKYAEQNVAHTTFGSRRRAPNMEDLKKESFVEPPKRDENHLFTLFKTFSPIIAVVIKEKMNCTEQEAKKMLENPESSKKLATAMRNAVENCAHEFIGHVPSRVQGDHLVNLFKTFSPIITVVVSERIGCTEEIAKGMIEDPESSKLLATAMRNAAETCAHEFSNHFASSTGKDPL